ncbi:glycosyltransferase family 2 protein [Lichenicoccus sp.]|uniref:glycosyltransferase family 2 protein n=1 Tax=Lichenicoccus sp. TaxID=2781899 RepID=UPI003D105985
MTDALIAGSLPTEADYDADIVILSMDRIEETLEAVASALSQQGLRRHVFVFDQGSTADNLQRLQAAIDGHDNIALLRAERNWGVAGGRNRVSALGRGRVIVALDNDAEFADSGTVARAVARLRAEHDLAAIGFRIVIHASGEDDLSSWGYARTLLARAGESFDAVTFVGAGHAISRAAWDACGGYDDALFFCWEEFDFCLQAISLGWRIRYDGDLVIRHKVSPDRRFNWSGSRWFYYVRNRLYIGHKWQSWVSLAPRAAGYILRGARNGLLAQTLRAIPAAWRLGRTQRGMRMSEAGRAYLLRNDAAHRGTLVTRLAREVFAALPGHGMKEASTPLG